MTQEQLALDTNLTAGFIALVESGTRLPSLGVLVALAGALRCDLPELLCVEATDPRADLLAALRRRDWSAVDAALDRLGHPPQRS